MLLFSLDVRNVGIVGIDGIYTCGHRMYLVVPIMAASSRGGWGCVCVCIEILSRTASKESLPATTKTIIGEIVRCDAGIFD